MHQSVRVWYGLATAPAYSTTMARRSISLDAPILVALLSHRALSTARLERRIAMSFGLWHVFSLVRKIASHLLENVRPQHMSASGDGPSH